MQKIATLVAAALVLGAVTVAAPVAWAGHGDDQLVVIATITDFDKEDRGPDGPSRGDKFTYRASLEDEDGEDAGRSRGGCVLTDEDGGGFGHGHHHGHMSVTPQGHGDDSEELVARCRAGFRIDGGGIFIGGTLTKEDFEDGTVTLPIREGRGDYEDADGEATIQFLDHHASGQSHDGDHHHGDAKGHHDGDRHQFRVTFDFS